MLLFPVFLLAFENLALILSLKRIMILLHSMFGNAIFVVSDSAVFSVWHCSVF